MKISQYQKLKYELFKSPEKRTVQDQFIDSKKYLQSVSYTENGLYIMRNNDLCMIIDCIPNESMSPNNIRHNSSLSFEFYAYNRPFIVDPGTDNCAASSQRQDKFCSTSYHNTVSVDGREQNRFKRYCIKDPADIKIRQWESCENFDFLDARHNGYERFLYPVSHRRQIFFDKKHKYWIVRDKLVGVEQHRFDLYFHFAPMEVRMLSKHKEILNHIMGIRNKLINYSIHINDSLVVETNNNSGANLLLISLDTRDISVNIEEGLISSDSKIMKAPVVKYSKTSKCPVEFVTILYPFVGEREIGNSG